MATQQVTFSHMGLVALAGELEVSLPDQCIDEPRATPYPCTVASGRTGVGYIAGLGIRFQVEPMPGYGGILVVRFTL